MKEKKKQQLVYGIAFAAGILFYLLWYVRDGVILTPDAPSYINMESHREPGYCIYLWILRSLFGPELSLHIAVILQCLLAAYASCAFSACIQKRFRLSYVSFFLLLAIQYGMTLLNLFVASRRYSYFNSIETEGLTLSLWLLLVMSLLGILYDKDKKSVVKAVLWTVLLTAVRKQMLIAFGLLFLCLFIAWRKEKKWLRAAAAAAGVLAGAALLNVLLDCSYNLAARGVFAPHTGDSSFILGTELYVSGPEMEENISDPMYRDLFREITSRIEEKGYSSSFAQKGWMNEVNHFADSYDQIKFTVVNDVLYGYIRETYGEQADLDAHYNEIAGALMKDLLVPCLPALSGLFISNVIYGFVTTVAKVHPLLNWYALFIYGAYLALIALCLRKGGRTARAVWFAALVLTAIAANVALTSVTIYCQMRYMIYNTGLFYSAGYVMLILLVRERTGKFAIGEEA